MLPSYLKEQTYGSYTSREESFEEAPTSPDQRSHALKRRPPAKRLRAVSSNCAEAEVAAVATADVTDAAEEEIHEEVRTVNRLGGADAECLTEHAVCFASELQRVKDQLRSVKQQLHSCQRKLAKAKAQANEKRGMQETIQKLSGREMLIIDQCIMKANMKSTNSVRLVPWQFFWTIYYWRRLSACKISIVRSQRRTAFWTTLVARLQESLLK
ncbi:uncharacterized protein LOC125944117 [Dermacentor silvarum]|uniref:uncharacterized protein LOC125944117 n=1 Tax=Dermacentor silvarum TaxID=543639 RepID=UPI002100AD72|nr:uncharacterized protein LOC125944117 [Dermacentor silvarum]